MPETYLALFNGIQENPAPDNIIYIMSVSYKKITGAIETIHMTHYQKENQSIPTELEFTEIMKLTKNF